MRRRLAAAGCIGLLAAALNFWVRTRVTGFSDFEPLWLAARALLRHADPFTAATVGGWPLLYPMPAVIVASPLVVLPEAAAGAAWCGVGFGLLAFGLTRRGWWPLISLASWPAVEAAQLAQWSPLLTSIAFFPWLGFLAIAKPTTGAAIGAAYLERRSVLPNVVLAMAGLIVATIATPTWIDHWLGAVAAFTHYRPLALRSFGVVLLLALARWRRPEARMLALLALVPQSGMAYDAVPLALIASSRVEAIVLATCSLLAVPFQAVAPNSVDGFTAAAAHNATLYLVTLYAPALVMILRRPNEAPLREREDQRSDREARGGIAVVHGP